jgi:hypothetical protein
MYLLHYLIPIAIFYFYRDKIMLLGLLLGNLVDIDHIYYRLIGKVEWFGSACGEFGKNCSFGVYPFHSWTIFACALVVGILVFCKDKKCRFIGWLGLGIALNLILDYAHFLIGFGI